MRLTERKKCPVCESEQRKIVYSLPYGSKEIQEYLQSFYGVAGYPEPQKLIGFNFELAECGGCELIYQIHIPDDPSLAELYTKWISQDKVYELYEKRRQSHILESYFLTVKNLIDYFGHRDFKLFDYGFGYGHFLRQAILFGIDTYGFEFNPEQTALVRSFGVNIIENFDLDESEKMDVIFCEQVLEHTTHPREIMANLSKLSRKGTVLHLSVPNSHNVKQVLRTIDWKNMKGDDSSVNNFAPLEHINSFCEKQLVRLASDFGFKKMELSEKYQVTQKPEFEITDTKKYISAASLITRYWIKKLIAYKAPSRGDTSIYFIQE